jgi:hypothetical protein
MEGSIFRRRPSAGEMAGIAILAALTVSLGAQPDVVVSQATRLFTIPGSQGGGWDDGASPLGDNSVSPGSGGVTLTGLQKTIQDAIPPSRIADVERDGYRMLLIADVPVSASWLRIAVQDDRTGRIGSMELKLPLPPIPALSPIAPNK